MVRILRSDRLHDIIELMWFSGVINFFGPSLYSALGLSHSQSLLVQGIHGAVGPVTTFL